MSANNEPMPILPSHVGQLGQRRRRPFPSDCSERQERPRQNTGDSVVSAG